MVKISLLPSQTSPVITGLLVRPTHHSASHKFVDMSPSHTSHCMDLTLTRSVRNPSESDIKYPPCESNLFHLGLDFSLTFYEQCRRWKHHVCICLLHSSCLKTTADGKTHLANVRIHNQTCCAGTCMFADAAV